ncbi:ABC-type molybdate transport system substrate-binding protein [Arthrobacter ginsengisoli]|uniref:ABC-type molybdate transport system substrate-binding protein n=1 Tax=Arthrobacter ginsengisoli TaxID=1356565 RepID=A0ABU1UC78_9MICC|nr:substrate-binding domain-containing protein [Arthrobacter ginsengisoli]MDR7082814.1 ABC-type molybdate transport system substrate-binding protein [Arthrobacter ginsengisoli]
MTDRPALSVFCAVALRGAVQETLLPEFTRATGIAVDAHYATTSALVQEVDEGARPDVVIGITAALEKLAAAGVLDAASLATVAKAGIGIAVAPGVPVPDLSTVEDLIRALTAARSVAYSRTGPSGVYLAALLPKLGIADQVNERATVVDTGFTALALVDGRADLAVQQLSELKYVPEATIAGPFPAAVQHYTEFSAAIAVSARDRSGAAALLAHLTASPAQSAYTAAGLETAEVA